MKSVVLRAVPCLVTVLLVGAVGVGHAMAGTEVELTRLAVLVLPSDLQTAVANGTGYTGENIAVSSGDHQVTVKVINAALNEGTRSARQTEAKRIAAVVEHEIAARPELADAMVIHLDFVKRSGKDSISVQSVDFRKAPNGKFELHIT